MTSPQNASPAYQPYEGMGESSSPSDVMTPTADEDGAPESWLAEAGLPETPGAGGRTVLGLGLGLLATLWLGFSAWSAGLSLAGQPLSFPAVAQWVAVVTGPLALLGLVWLMFGRTRRREAEAFTRSVIAMRGEARALDGLLAVVRQRIDDNHLALRTMADQLMVLGDEAAGRLGAASAQLDEGARKLISHGETFDRAAHDARVDIGVLLEDLPKAEASARAMAGELQGTGRTAMEQAEALRHQIDSLGESARDAESRIESASHALSQRLGELQEQSSATAQRLQSIAGESSGTLDELLNRSSEVLEDIRSGIAIQSQAVSALVDQANVSLAQTGIETATALRDRLAEARTSLDHLSDEVARQDESSRSLIASIGTGLASLDERFAAFADLGDRRSLAIGETMSRLRGEIEAIGQHAEQGGAGLDRLAERTEALRVSVGLLADSLSQDVGAALGDAETSANRLLESAQAARPALAEARDLASEAGERIDRGAQSVEEQHDRLAALLAAVDTGVGGAERRLTDLSEAIAGAQSAASGLTSETGPALVASLVQVKEAATHAAERAREAISTVIPESAGRLSEAARIALEQAVQESVASQLSEVEATASRAVEAARDATERLMQQMLSIGQSAAALEAHMAQNEEDRRERDSEAFAKRVSLLIDSMNSASIDVGKILSDDVDDKSWTAYLKGDRGVFTRRAARLIGSNETRALQAHYEADREFQESVNRYVHDFESMIRRVTAERDGGPMAVTLMSSDMGKLYAALAQVAGGRR